MRYVAVVLAMLSVSATAAAQVVPVHQLKIEQVIAGVHGDTGAQAVQLRMRANVQTELPAERLRVWDAQGQNPIVLVDFTTNVPNINVGDRVLVASSQFLLKTSSTAAPDFLLTNLIPASYFAAGSLTFETDAGTVYWRLSWGGAGYTGPNNGHRSNDPDGDFGPPFPGPLRPQNRSALRFQGLALKQSTTNADDYVRKNPSFWRNNADESIGLLANSPPTFAPPSPCGQTILASVGAAVTFSIVGSDSTSDPLFLDATGVPAGAAHTPPLPAPGSATFDWTPTNLDVGTHVIVYTVSDPKGASATCSVTIHVGGGGPAGVPALDGAGTLALILAIALAAVAVLALRR